jgi:phosphatidylglycerol---prolipoprotein diacylglyceryl transferase
MIPYPNISPEIISFGPFALRWYGLMYVIGFVFGFHILKARIRAGYLKVSMNFADAYITYIVIGMLLGARLVYVFVYNWEYYALHPGEILAIWTGGLSFHGAALGMMFASLFYARRLNVSFHSVLDTLAIAAPIGLFAGRIGNFINAELYGRVSDVPWAMVFPTDPLQLPRHPSQLYQSLTEGLLLFVILCVAQRRLLRSGRLKNGMLGALFVAGYGVLRFFVEFTREPDPQLGLVLGPFSMGQVLCFLMVAISVLQWIYVEKTQDFVKLCSPKEALAKPNFLERGLARWTAPKL